MDAKIAAPMKFEEFYVDSSCMCCRKVSSGFGHFGFLCIPVEKSGLTGLLSDCGGRPRWPGSCVSRSTRRQGRSKMQPVALFLASPRPYPGLPSSKSPSNVHAPPVKNRSTNCVIRRIFDRFCFREREAMKTNCLATGPSAKELGISSYRVRKTLRNRPDLRRRIQRRAAMACPADRGSADGPGRRSAGSQGCRFRCSRTNARSSVRLKRRDHRPRTRRRHKPAQMIFITSSLIKLGIFRK
jgi:hypothetical protein